MAAPRQFSSSQPTPSSDSMSSGIRRSPCAHLRTATSAATRHLTPCLPLGRPFTAQAAPRSACRRQIGRPQKTSAFMNPFQTAWGSVGDMGAQVLFLACLRPHASSSLRASPWFVSVITGYRSLARSLKLHEGFEFHETCGRRIATCTPCAYPCATAHVQPRCEAPCQLQSNSVATHVSLCCGLQCLTFVSGVDIGSLTLVAHACPP